MELQYYFFWSSSSLIIFYLFYLLLLKRETFFVLNRIYLLTALCLSTIIPFLDFSTFVEIHRIELIVSTFSVIGAEKLTNGSNEGLNWLALIYCLGVGVSFILLLLKLAGVKKQLNLATKGMAFSFWKTKVIDQKLDGFEAINAHENVHIKQFHTLDILFVELINVFFWFNPVVYCYRKSLKLIHEYLADKFAVNFTTSKKQYAMVLFLQNFKAGSSLANTFYNASSLELRIKMLQRKKSNDYSLLKYVLFVPLVALLALLCSFDAANFIGNDHYKINKAASFPGGFEAFSSYLKKTVRKVSSKNDKVKVSFVVEANGEVTNEKIESGLDEANNNEALRLIKYSPKWEPALQNGNKVRSAYDININF